MFFIDTKQPISSRNISNILEDHAHQGSSKKENSQTIPKTNTKKQYQFHFEKLKQIIVSDGQLRLNHELDLLSGLVNSINYKLSKKDFKNELNSIDSRNLAYNLRKLESLLTAKKTRSTGNSRSKKRTSFPKNPKQTIFYKSDASHDGYSSHGDLAHSDPFVLDPDPCTESHRPPAAT